MSVQLPLLRRTLPLMVLSSLLMASCAPTPSPTVPPSGQPGSVATPAPAAAAPKRGGTIVMYTDRGVQTIDPHKVTGIVDQYAMAGLYSGLIRLDPTDPSKIIPDLATSWDVSGDGSVYVFKLRSGVKFHDGQPLSAQDVKASIDRLLDPKLASPRSGGLVRALIESVEVTDPTTVTVRLRKPVQATALATFASPWIKIAPKKSIDASVDFSTTANGTGPFKLKSYSTTRVVWERNPEYFISGRPYLDGVEFIAIPDGGTKLASIRTGQVNLSPPWPSLSSDDAKNLLSALGKNGQQFRAPQALETMLFLNPKVKPLDDPRVRKAIFLAIDRNEIAGKIWGNEGVPSAVFDSRVFGDFTLPKAEMESLPGLGSKKDQDLVAAKQLLKEAGVTDGTELPILTRTYGVYPELSAVLASQLGKIGLKLRIDSVDPTGGLTQATKGDFVLFPADAGFPLTDPSSVMSDMYVAGGTRNYPGIDDPTIKDMYQKQLVATNAAQRKEILIAFQKYILEGSTPYIPLMWLDRIQVGSSAVKGYVPGKTIYDNNELDAVWLDQ